MLAFPPPLLPEGAARFLQRYWQKQPLWLPGAIERDALLDIEPDELAWLALQEDVESRLVFTEDRNGRLFYRMEAGPFDERTLKTLPESNWTLLVQDVEKHLPALRSYFELVPFIPDWRIDDLMISVAAPGGSVGPHKDNYDVFLVQSSGHRQWSWTTEPVPDDPEASAGLRLLETFASEASELAGPGDVLYLNPGVAHHGVATDLCVTCSIGMRAPQVSELAGRPVEGSDEFYADPDLDIAEAVPGYISAAAIARAQSLLAQHRLGDIDVEQALGRFATSPKDWLTPEPDRDLAMVELPLAVHGMARLGWSETSAFANGRRSPLDPAARQDFERLCFTRMLDAVTLDLWQHESRGEALLEFLWSAGVFDPDVARDD